MTISFFFSDFFVIFWSLLWDALDHYNHKGQLYKSYSESFGSQNPPSVVIQNAQPARTFVLISAQAGIVSDASRVALNVDKSNFFPIVGINAVSTAESYQLSLVVTTASGVRLYYTTADNNTSNVRPHNLILQHVRLPPGFACDLQLEIVF